MSLITTRRSFIVSSAAVTAATLLACRRSQADPKEAGDDRASPPTPLKILILGGTGFIGPALVEVAKAHGHTLTLFNRGTTNPGLFPEIEKLRGDRDPRKGDGLKALEGGKWDVVFDDCGYFPRMVKASAELLAPNVKHYVFVSSISAYADTSTEDADETAALATMADPNVESFGPANVNYGPLKVLCEQAAEAACPGRTTIVRPGYIVGPGDPTDRFTWWPLRVERGGEMLVPGAPTDPIQIIDVRDLAEWMIHIAEQRTIGTFNALGPERRLTMQDTLTTCKEITKSDVKLTWVGLDFLASAGANLEDEWPIWAPYAGKSKGFHTCSNARAIASGLKFRTIRDTVEATLAWFKSLPEKRQAAVKSGVPEARERELLEKWQAGN